MWIAVREPRWPRDRRERGGLLLAIAFTAGSALVLSTAGRLAERYAFSASFVLAAAGAAVTYRSWPALRAWLARADAAIPAFPALAWIALLTLRLLLGPRLPRIG